MTDAGGPQDARRGDDTLLLYYQPVYQYCFLMLYRQADEAKDATQEMFARTYQRRDQPPTAPRAWLLGIAHYVCLEMRRQHRKQQRPLPPEAPAWAPDPQTLAAASLDVGRLQQCLNTLEPAQRSLVVLPYPTFFVFVLSIFRV